MNPSRWLVLAALVLLTAGCASQTSRDTGIDKLSPRKAEQALNTGIQQYEDGELKAAQKNLQDALSLGLTFDSDKVTAQALGLHLLLVESRTAMPRRIPPRI